MDLHVESSGEGRPVVLLHGLTASHRYVVMGSRRLERSGHRVVAYDARGHGDSDPAPDGAYGYDVLARDLERVLDEQEIERAVLVGASMGAHTSIRFALDRPERVAGLVVVTPAYVPGNDVDPVSLERWDRLSEGLRSGGVEGFLAAYHFDDVPEDWRPTVRRVTEQRLSVHAHPEAVADALRSVPRSAAFGSLDELAAITTPTVIVGDHDAADPGHPLAIAKTYAATIPGAELVVEEPGKSPIAWQGGQLSQVIAGLVERADWA